MTEAVSILTIDARGAEAGSAAYVRAMRAAQAAADRTLDVERKATEARERSGMALVRQSDTIARSAQAWDRLRASVDPHVAAQKAIEQAQLRADAAIRRGVTSQEEAARVLDLVRKRYAETTGAVNDNSAAMGELQRQGGLARHELINLSRQAQDVAVSLASGQSPFTVLIQQGSQIADVFATSQGTVGGFFRQVSTGLLRILPMATAASAALVGVYSTVSVAGERQQLNNSLLGAGRGVGLSGGQFDALAKESAEAAKITVSSSRLIAAEYARLGQLAATQLPRVTQVTKDYALVTGQDMTSAAKELARALADPTKGAELLADKVGHLDATTLRSIRTAESYGDKLRAQKLLVEGLAQALDGAANAQSKWDRLIEQYWSRPVDRAKNTIADTILGPDVSEKVAKLDQQLKDLRQAATTALPGTDLSGVNKDIAALERRKAVLEGEIKVQQDLAKARGDAAETNRKMTAADAVSREVRPIGPEIERLQEQASKLQAGYKAAEEAAVKLFSADEKDYDQAKFLAQVKAASELKGSLERVNQQLKEYREAEQAGSLEADKAARAQEIRGRFLNQFTVEAKAAEAAELALNEARGSALSPTERQAQAELAGRDAFMAAVRAREEAKRASNDNLASLGAETKAMAENGAAAAEMARLREAAKVEARTTNESPDVVFERMQRQELEKTNLELARIKAQKAEITNVERAANAAAANGNLSAKQRAELEERLRAERDAYNKLAATGLVSEREAVRLAKEQAAAVARGQDTRTDAAADDYIYQQRQTLQTLEKQIALIRMSRDARHEEIEQLRARQFLDENGISAESERGRKILENATLIGRQNREYEVQLRLQNQIRQEQEFAADSAKSFLDDLLTGTEGLNGALKSLGKGFQSASLDALISGKGPLASSAGLASPTRDGQGGILGLLTGNLKPLSDAVAKGTAKGSAEGFETGWHRAGANDNFRLFGNINGKDLAGGLTAIAGLAGSYGSGLAAGSYAQAGIGGALSGGMAGLSLAGTSIGASLGGAAVLGPLGLIAGAGLAIFGQQQARQQQKKEQRRQALEAYRDAQPQIAQFGAQLRGDPQGTMAQRFEEARASTQKLGDIAVVAGRPDEAIKLFSDLATFRERVIGEFRSSFDGMLAAFSDGTGPNSPFAAARDSVKSLGDQLKVFVDDAKTSFGDGAPQIEQAREAARDYALSVLDGAREMSVAATRMEEIRGAGAGLRQVLTDLGMSAADAARAVEAGTVAALARLKMSFEDDLGRKTNSALDKGYLNDAADLIKELAALRADAAALGSDQGLVTDYFRAQAQSIVDGAELTGEAFADLIRRFPALNGYVSEFAEKIDAAAKAAEIAARRLGYQDRLFAALNDTTTLEGQLAAFDRTALREREAEIKAGGEAINDLEMAQAAERFNIIRDFNQKAIDDQKRAAEEAQNFFDTFSRNLKQFVDNMRSGADTPLSPEARLAAAQSQYNAQLALAQSGNRDAINGLTGYADALLDAGRAFYGSSAAFQSIFSQIEAQLTALPTQVSAEQFIVNAVNDSKNATVAALATMQAALANSFQTSAATGSAGAIASALSVYFNALDANTDNLLSSAEYFAGLGPLATSAEQSAARAIFNSIDADGDGQLSRLELIRASTQEGVAKTDYTNALLAQSQAIEAQTQNIIAATRDLQGAANSILATQSGMLSTQTALLDQIRALNNTSTGTLAALNNQFSLNAALNIGGVGLENNMVTALNKIVYNTAGTWSAVAKSAVPAAYATGGWISGPGTGTSDSILLRASNGEFMVNAEAAARNRSVLEAINGGADVMRAMPMLPVPSAPMAPANSNSSAAEIRMLREELRAVRAELAGIKRAVVAGAEHVREGVDQGTAAQRDSSRELKFRKRA